MGPNGRMLIEEAGDPAPISTSQDTIDMFDELLHRLPTSQQQLERQAREFFLAKHRSIAKDGQGRDQRFVHRGVLEPAKTDSDDGYVSDDDCIAVLYDITEGGPRSKKQTFRVYYGNVAKVTYNKVGKRVPGPRAHLREKSGEAVCKWFEEALDKRGNHKVLKGQRAYHPRLNNPTGFNEKVEFANILAGVRMTLDSESDCWLLNADDYTYAETQMQNYSNHQNSTQAHRAKHGEWVKDVRQSHDKLKTKVLGQLAVSI